MHCRAAESFAAPGGVIMHYDGHGWSEMDSGTTRPLKNIWGRSGSDVYAVGGDVNGGLVLHYDGLAWSEFDLGMDTPTQLWDVWGIGDELWIVGVHSIYHFDGSTWLEEHPLGVFELVWGTAADAVHILSGDNSLLYNGAELVPSPVGAYGRTMSIGGSPEVGVFVGSQDGLFVHWDGQRAEAFLYADGNPYFDWVSIWADGHTVFLASPPIAPHRLVFHW